MTTMRLLSWNVNGLRAIARKGFGDWLQAVAPDVLCVQETKLQEPQVPDALRHLADYQAWFVSAERPGYSGVALYSRVAPQEVGSGFDAARFDSEGRVVWAVYDRFVLYNVYFPNGGASAARLRYKLDFYDAFLAHIQHRVAAGQQVIVCGDVNTAHRPIDLARPAENQTRSGFLPEERAWVDRLLAAGWIDTFRMFCDESGHYSWWDYKTRARQRNVGWRIDYFFVNQALRDHVAAATIHPEVMGSDHCPVGLDVVF